jgi:hypothetical protein
MDADQIPVVCNRNPKLDSNRTNLTTKCGRPKCDRHLADYNSTCYSVAIVCPNDTTSAMLEPEILPLAVTNSGPPVNVSEQRSNLNTIPVTNATIIPPIISQLSGPGLTRKSTRTKTTRDFLKPKFPGKAYNIGNQRMYNFKEQRMPACDSEMDENWYLRPMPKSTLPPVFRKGPLNLNADGTKINYKNRIPDNAKYIGNRLTPKK